MYVNSKSFHSNLKSSDLCYHSHTLAGTTGSKHLRTSFWMSCCGNTKFLLLAINTNTLLLPHKHQRKMSAPEIYNQQTGQSAFDIPQAEKCQRFTRVRLEWQNRKPVWVTGEKCWWRPDTARCPRWVQLLRPLQSAQPILSAGFGAVAASWRLFSGLQWQNPLSIPWVCSFLTETLPAQRNFKSFLRFSLAKDTD